MVVDVRFGVFLFFFSTVVKDDGEVEVGCERNDPRASALGDRRHMGGREEEILSSLRECQEKKGQHNGVSMVMPTSIS